MLLQTIKQDIQDSLKRGEKVRVDTLRFLVSQLQNAAIAKYGNVGETGLTDEDVLSVVKKQVKTHKESIEAFTQAGRTDLSQKEQQELTILEAFLPKEISDEELRRLLSSLSTSEEKNFGRLMGEAMKLVAGRAEGGRVSAMVKTMLAK